MHFVGGKGPTESHPDPIPATARGVERRIFESRKIRSAPTKRKSPSGKAREAPEDVEYPDENQIPDITVTSEFEKDLNANSYTFNNNVATELGNTSPDNEPSRLLYTDKCVSFEHLQVYTDKALSNTKLLKRELFLKDVEKDDKSCKFYTDNPVNNDNGHGRVLSTYETLVLVLVRLRRGMDVEHLADCFGVSNATASRYSNTLVEFLCKELAFLIKWPLRDHVRASLPNAFRNFKRTIAIIDYLWPGSVSDKRIVQGSSFMDYIKPGDVMADRGFLIRDLLALQGATLNNPPFAHGNQLSSSAVTKTRRIASARIHVERAIGRLKYLKILQGVFPLNSKTIMNQTVDRCAQLCNLDKVLVK
uniref:Uncharacterized protein LOC102810070 n=1 Tax=Saccoglossus kowalevskii TaxID=10224 RepID=A0ABM0MLP5_SACKO|nr:PREDICTED: uncharacterized protein LOC102810070 [Saccoglossus kowalevskii]